MNVVARLRPMLLGLGLVGFGVLSFMPAALAASAPPSLSFTPSSWTAGPIGSDTTTSQTFTLTNTGGKASGAIKAVTLSGSSAFTTTADTCTGTSLGPNKSCTVTVRYAPTSNGESDTAMLSVNAVQASATADLRGSSTNPNPFAVSKAACEALGGTFSTNISTDATGAPANRFVWSCNNGPSQAFSAGLVHDCAADVAAVFGASGIGGMGFTGGAPYDSTCYNAGILP